MVQQHPVILTGRHCGTCTICCTLLPISTERFRKTANQLCKHCDDGQGCRIYQSRPDFCRNFYCEWRLNPQIPATWRPEKSGIFIQRISREHIEGIPDTYDSPYALIFVLLRPDSVERPALVETIAGYVYRHVPVFLALPGPVGYLPAQILLNEAMEAAVAQRDPGAMTIILRQALQALKRQEFEAVPEFG